MRHQTRSLAALPPAKTSMLVVALAFALGGCAQFPSLDQLARLKPAADYQTSAALAAPAIVRAQAPIR